MPHRKQSWAKRNVKDRFKRKYLTRMQASRLLQVDSMNFRRLCILKGVYPRAQARSKQKVSGNEKQYYLAKEIKWLVRDQLTNRIAAFGAWEKKVRRAKAMQQKRDLQTLQSMKVKPQYSLDATIKERYPYFVDAVRDIDDAMSMIALYAFLSPEVKSNTTIEFHHALPSGLHQRAKDLVAQWMSYVARAHCLNKAFISVKGYYYEAVVKGERILWTMPHEYASKFPSGIQQYILITFLEFYVQLMSFVLFKLEHDLKKELEEVAASEETGEADAQQGKAETFAVGALETSGTASANKANIKSLLEQELQKVAKIFDGLVFYISREVPKKHCQLVVEAAGGRVVSTFGPGVTHYIVDRPQLLAGHTKLDSVEYVQPQYVFDCLNARALLPAQGYRIGEVLPPHISPFTVSISNSKEDQLLVEETRKAHPKILGHVPKRVHEIRKLLDPTYNPIDPDGKVAGLLDEFSDEDDERAAGAPAMDGDDDVSLSGSDLAEASRKPKWDEEEVTESVARPALSAFKVKKQRELNLLNKPTSEEAAARRQEIAKAKLAKRQAETREQRIKRKLAEVESNDRATRKMQLQVARKKAARYYKMVSSVVEGNAKKEKILAAKAKAVEEGKATAEGGKEFRSTNPNKKPKAVKNPYSKLPKWVR